MSSRERFEAWVTSTTRDASATDRIDTEYLSPRTEKAWQAWQARDAEVAAAEAKALMLEGKVLMLKSAHEAELAELVEVLHKVITAHEAEARAKLAMETAADNYTDSRPEQDAFAKAATRSSEAEKAARALLAKHKEAT